MKYTSWKKFKPAWLKALRSGQYKRTAGTLCREGEPHDSFCCLGVAADLLVLAGQGEWQDNGELVYKGVNGSRCDATLSPSAPKWLSKVLDADYMGAGHLEESMEDRLVKMNDTGRSFNQIANFIEERMP